MAPPGADLSAELLEDPRSADPRSAEFVDRFTAFLQTNSFLDELGIKRAQRAQKQSGERIDLVIMRLGLLSDKLMAKALSIFCNLPLTTEEAFPDERLPLEDIDAGFLKRSGVLPIADTGDKVELAVTDPFNGEAVAAISYLLGRPVGLSIAAAGDIEKAIGRLYGAQNAKRDIDEGSSAAAAEETGDADVQRLEDMASEAPVIRLVQDLIVRAANDLASDIHIEPREDCVRIRTRLDGVLHTIENLPIGVRDALGSRVKIMAKLNIAERRLPQDGRVKVNVRGREIDLRVSTMPTLWGESIVMRLLDRSSVELDFAKLGFAGSSYEDLRALLDQPNGIILVTGPTGSGKTTTLYTALSQLNSPDRKVFTVEDPIEYQMPGINQIQVQPKIGLTFATALRSILRQDPDIIMVGEIRDLETAQIAIQASLTGHLVLSTVHTNSAAATLTRFLDMGVEKYLLTSTVKGVLAQRLVRRLCTSCAAPSSDTPHVLRWLESTGIDPGALVEAGPPRVLRAVGCPSCRQTGFSGRTTIFELLVMSERIREAISAGHSESEIQKVSMAERMTTMLQSGLLKVLKGETTVEEVLRVARFDACLDSDTALTISTAP